MLLSKEYLPYFEVRVGTSQTHRGDSLAFFFFESFMVDDLDVTSLELIYDATFPPGQTLWRVVFEIQFAIVNFKKKYRVFPQEDWQDPRGGPARRYKADVMNSAASSSLCNVLRQDSIHISSNARTTNHSNAPASPSQ